MVRESVINKYIFLLWETDARPPGENRDRLVNRCAPTLLELGLSGLSVNVDDEYSSVKSPAPKWYRGPEICATVSAWFDEELTPEGVAGLLSENGFRVAGYRVTESIYKDYGDNRHSEPRDWPDGERSPGVLAVTLLTRPKRYDKARWIERWHGRMSPISETIQPRQRYVRNIVDEVVTDGAPPFDGIVEEAWPSPEHISNPYLFYCADNPWQLVKHMGLMLYAILQFHNLFKFRTTTMSEYFIRTDAGPQTEA